MLITMTTPHPKFRHQLAATEKQGGFGTLSYIHLFFLLRIKG